MRHAYWKRQAAELGIPVDFRMLRRTCATLLQAHANIKDTQQILGHADASTTLGIYQQAIPESVRRATEGLSEALESGGPIVQ